jgi:hypothetical protein
MIKFISGEQRYRKTLKKNHKDIYFQHRINIYHIFNTNY